MKRTIIAGLLLSNVLYAAFCAAEESTIPYPVDYRNWHHVKSMLIGPAHGLAQPFQGLHHVYANELALSGMQSGTYSDGATLAFDLLESKQENHATVEGPRKFLAVMTKNSKMYSNTGGWGFEAFRGDSRSERMVQDNGDACFACHTAQKQQDYVFSTLRK